MELSPPDVAAEPADNTARPSQWKAHGHRSQGHRRISPTGCAAQERAPERRDGRDGCATRAGRVVATAGNCTEVPGCSREVSRPCGRPEDKEGTTRGPGRAGS